MENPRNIWFQSNKRKIEALKRQLIEYNYAGSYGGNLDLMQIIQTIDGAILEIVKMDKKLIELETELKQLKAAKDEKKKE